MSASRENSITLNSDIGRAGYTQNQDKAVIALFNHFLIDVLGFFSINDMKVDYLEDEVENMLMDYSIYMRDTNIPKNHQACLDDPNKDHMGYLKYTSLVEYLSKDINFLRKLVPNSDLFKDEEALADILGEKFKKGYHRRQQVKDNSFGQETKICLYCTARHGNSYFTPHFTNLINCE